MTETLLPNDPNEALQTLIKLTKDCVEILESEDDAMTRNDGVAFSVTEQNKTASFDHYAKACQEFMARAEEITNQVQTSLLDDLSRLQETLKKQAEQNNVRLKAILPEIRKAK